MDGAMEATWHGAEGRRGKVLLQEEKEAAGSLGPSTPFDWAAGLEDEQIGNG